MGILVVFFTFKNYGLYAASYCKEKHYGNAAAMSTSLLFGFALLAIVGTLVTFFCSIGGSTSAIHAEDAAERASLVQKAPPPPPKPKEEEEEEDDKYEREDPAEDDGIE